MQRLDRVRSDSIDRPPRPTCLEVVRGAPLFAGLSEAARRAVARESFLAFAECGEVIWRPEDASEFVGVVGIGLVRALKLDIKGDEVTLGPGSEFGGFASDKGGLSLAGSDCWYLKIPRGVIREVLQTDYDRSGPACHLYGVAAEPDDEMGVI